MALLVIVGKRGKLEKVQIGCLLKRMDIKISTFRTISQNWEVNKGLHAIFIGCSIICYK